MFSNSGIAYIGVFLVILVFLLRVLLKPGRRPALNARNIKRIESQHVHQVHLEALSGVLDSWLPWDRWLVENPESEITKLFDHYRLRNDSAALDKLLNIARDALNDARQNPAMLTLWVIYSGRIRGADASHQDADYWLDRAAESGDAAAAYTRACRKLRDSLLRGVHLDPEEIINMMQPALAAGLPEARFATFCLELTARRRNDSGKTQLQLLTQSARSGFLPAQYMVFRIHRDESPLVNEMDDSFQKEIDNMEQNLLAHHPEARFDLASSRLKQGLHDKDKGSTKAALKELENLSIAGMKKATGLLTTSLQNGSSDDINANALCERASLQGFTDQLYQCYIQLEKQQTLPDIGQAAKQLYADECCELLADSIARLCYVALVDTDQPLDAPTREAVVGLLKKLPDVLEDRNTLEEYCNKLQQNENDYSRMLTVLLDDFASNSSSQENLGVLEELAGNGLVPARIHLLHEAERSSLQGITEKPWFVEVAQSCGYAAWLCATLSSSVLSVPADSVCHYLRAAMSMGNTNSINLCARHINGETHFTLLDSAVLDACKFDRDEIRESLKRVLSKSNPESCDLYARFCLQSDKDLARAAGNQRNKVWQNSGEAELWELYRHLVEDDRGKDDVEIEG